MYKSFDNLKNGVKTKDGFEKNMKRDKVHILFDGIDRIQWRSDAINCITNGAVGVLPDFPNGEYPEALTACVIKDKNLLEKLQTNRNIHQLQ